MTNCYCSLAGTKVCFGCPNRDFIYGTYEITNCDTKKGCVLNGCIT